MRPKIQIVSRLWTAEELAKKLGVTKKEQRAVDAILERIFVTRKSRPGRVVQKNASKLRGKKASLRAKSAR